MFFKPKPERLAKNKDLGGLVKCITGSDPALAQEAAALLGDVLRTLPWGPEAKLAIDRIAADDRPAATAALISVLRCNDPHPAFSGGGLWHDEAALALYERGVTTDLQEIIQDVRHSPYAGHAFHMAVTTTLLDRAVEKGDQHFVEFLLINGKFQHPPYAAFTFLEQRDGPDAIARVVDDPALFSSNTKSTGFIRLGRTFEAKDMLWHE